MARDLVGWVKPTDLLTLLGLGGFHPPYNNAWAIPPGCTSGAMRLQITVDRARPTPMSLDIATDTEVARRDPDNARAFKLRRRKTRQLRLFEPALIRLAVARS